MLKHIGKHNDRKAVILYRTVPGEDHMCLVVYSDLLPRLIHDNIMMVLESDSGQQAGEFADALFRHIMTDGRNTLTVLHSEGYIKKVPTNQIIVTPTSTSSVRLDELNEILTKMRQGEEAVKELADLDKNRGLKDPRKQVELVGEPKNIKSEPTAVNTNVLTDADLARMNLDQAATLESNAQRLLEEAARLRQEAQALSPAPKAKNVVKKTTKRVAQEVKN
jgi:hypothetical protein